MSNSIFCRKQKNPAQKEKAMMGKFIFQNHCLLFAGIANDICLKQKWHLQWDSTQGRKPAVSLSEAKATRESEQFHFLQKAKKSSAKRKGNDGKIYFSKIIACFLPELRMVSV